MGQAAVQVFELFKVIFDGAGLSNKSNYAFYICCRVISAIGDVTAF